MGECGYVERHGRCYVVGVQPLLDEPSRRQMPPKSGDRCVARGTWLFGWRRRPCARASSSWSLASCLLPPSFIKLHPLSTFWTNSLVIVLSETRGSCLFYISLAAAYRLFYVLAVSYCLQSDSLNLKLFSPSLYALSSV